MDNLGPNKKRRKSNKKWAFTAVGLLAVITLIIIYIFSMDDGTADEFKELGPYKEALSTSQTSPWVIKRLGEPIEVYGTPEGNITSKSSVTNAELQINIKGPDNKGTLVVWARKTDSIWNYRLMQVTIDDTKEVFDLLTNNQIQN